MNILFLTLQYDSRKEKEYLSKSKASMQGAANTFQNNLLSGFLDVPHNIKVMNTLPVATFPKYSQIFMKTGIGSILDFDTTEIGYINLPLFKQTTRYFAYKKQVKKWIKETKGEKAIVAYSLYLPFEKIFKFVKKHYPEVKTSLICPDLPCEYGILPKNKIKAAIQYSYGKKLLKFAKYSDSFTLLTEEMKHPLKLGERPFTVVEGVCNAKPTEKTEEKTILYTGTLHKQFGILTLLEAFSQIEEPDAKLWICGGGDSKQAVIDAAEKDNRITFFGYVAKDKVEELQGKASLLINPRANDGHYTKYSFPSKTMEYMTSGKPVVMYKLDGIPAEYDPYLCYIKGNSAEEMKETILSVLAKTQEERNALGLKAAEFVSQNKNSTVQAEKIINLLFNME